MIDQNSIILQNQNLVLFIPENPLSMNALSIGHTQTKSFSNWTKQDDIQTYYQLQKMILVWRKYFNRDHYLVYGTNGKEGFQFEGVPFKKKVTPLTSQLKILYRLMTKGHRISESIKLAMKKDYLEKFEKTPLLIEKNLSQFIKMADSFCRAEVLEKQTIFKGKKIRVLVDYAPLSGGKNPLHFLIVPIEHKATFQDLSCEEYTEAMHYAKLLYGYYNQMQPHIFHKNGKVAGQSIDHWHLHVVFTASKSQELMSKLKMLKNMLIGPTPLSEEELNAKLIQAKQELLPIFEKSVY